MFLSSYQNIYSEKYFNVQYKQTDAADRIGPPYGKFTRHTEEPYSLRASPSGDNQPRLTDDMRDGVEN